MTYRSVNGFGIFDMAFDHGVTDITILRHIHMMNISKIFQGTPFDRYPDRMVPIRNTNLPSIECYCLSTMMWSQKCMVVLITILFIRLVVGESLKNQHNGLEISLAETAL